ncbi:unnamed protein product, partial [Prorocentrum cordatum]
ELVGIADEEKPAPVPKKAKAKDVGEANGDKKMDLLRTKLDALKRKAEGKGTHGTSSEKPRLEEVIAGRVAGMEASSSRPSKKEDISDDDEPVKGKDRSALRALAGTLKSASKDSDSDDEDAEHGGDSSVSKLVGKRLAFKKMARKHPGITTEREIRNTLALLDEGEFESDDKSLPPACTRFLLRVFKPEHPLREVGVGKCREMRTLAEAMGLLRGKPAQALDYLMSRFRTNQKELKDGHPRASRWLELIPPETQGCSLNEDDEEMALG